MTDYPYTPALSWVHPTWMNTGRYRFPEACHTIHPAREQNHSLPSVCRRPDPHTHNLFRTLLHMHNPCNSHNRSSWLSGYAHPQARDKAPPSHGSVHQLSLRFPEARSSHQQFRFHTLPEARPYHNRYRWHYMYIP